MEINLETIAKTLPQISVGIICAAGYAALIYSAYQQHRAFKELQDEKKKLGWIEYGPNRGTSAKN